MKKIFIIASLLVSGYMVKAQDFKPTKGAITTDFGITEGLLDTELDFAEYGNNSGGLLRFRYFTKDDLAIRVGFGMLSNVYDENAFGSNPNEIGTRKSKSTGFNLNMGIEKHFKGTERLSPYVGADLQIGASKSTTEFNNFNNSTYEYNSSSTYTYTTNHPKYTTLGLRGVIGADYYIAQGLFVGVEAGLGFNYNKQSKGTYNAYPNPSPSDDTSSKNSSINNYIISAIRLGFKF